MHDYSPLKVEDFKKTKNHFVMVCMPNLLCTLELFSLSKYPDAIKNVFYTQKTLRP